MSSIHANSFLMSRNIVFDFTSSSFFFFSSSARVFRSSSSTSVILKIQIFISLVIKNIIFFYRDCNRPFTVCNELISSRCISCSLKITYIIIIKSSFFLFYLTLTVLRFLPINHP